ncbi:nitrous oxide reductase family maturation protein NosD [Kitasatospora sp. NPDC052896]|uniref:nitrous oxide reductase family maturation protein NosD n=1 Tax=Kitasatospora sp. NPDC052896 TaxID=3364061 RepID=UPI0037CB31BA
MFIRRTHHLAALAAFAVACQPAALAAHAAGSHTVQPGQSIQQAVDSAQPGDTIQLLPGTYRESVTVTRSGLTIRGAGRQTVLRPGDTAPAGSCAAGGHGICVSGPADRPVSGVRIESLAVTGFKQNGIWASGTDQLAVHDVFAHDNGQYGIAAERSTRSAVTANEAADNGQAGVFLANLAVGKGGAIDTHGAEIADNRFTGNRIGVVVRRARAVTVERNTATGNGGGVFLVGDDGVPRAGDVTIRANILNENNKFFPATSRLDVVQGVGILLTGAEDSRVTDNQVKGNRGGSSLSGGIVFFPSYVGAPVSRVSVQNNMVLDNGPGDLVDHDKGTGNTFQGNTCRVSMPAGRC